MKPRSTIDERSAYRTTIRGPAATAILDEAERLAQTRGYNGFSCADIAARLGVTKASLHYHFRSKADLGRALIDRYRAGFDAALTEIDRQGLDARDRLRRYVSLYQTVLSNDRMCLRGLLGACVGTLPVHASKGLAGV